MPANTEVATQIRNEHIGLRATDNWIPSNGAGESPQLARKRFGRGFLELIVIN